MSEKALHLGTASPPPPCPLQTLSYIHSVSTFFTISSNLGTPRLPGTARCSRRSTPSRLHPRPLRPLTLRDPRARRLDEGTAKPHTFQAKILHVKKLVARSSAVFRWQIAVRWEICGSQYFWGQRGDLQISSKGIVCFQKSHDREILLLLQQADQSYECMTA